MSTMEELSNDSQILKLVRSDRCLCPLCSNPRATFYCSPCIRFGDFSHSNPLKNEILAEKRIKLKEFSVRSSNISQTIQEKLSKSNEYFILVENKRLAELRIRYLREIIAQKRKKCENLKEFSDRIATLNSKRRIRLFQFSSRSKKMGEYFQNYCLKVIKLRNDLQDLQATIAPLRIKHLKDLVKLIFPIERICRTINKDELEDHDEVADILAEAMRTSFVHGRWITANSENAEEIQYRIVNPTLPSTGNYSSYYHYGAGDDQVVMIAPCSSPDAFEVSLIAGLSYVVQLVKLIALFTDVILPQRMSLSDFHSTSPCSNEYRFARRVASLNCNVVYLLCSIDDEFIIDDPLRTLQNIHSFILHLENYPNNRLSIFNDRQIKDPQALVSHIKKIFMEVSKVVPEEGNSSNNEDNCDAKELKDSDIDDDWISVPDIEPNTMMTPSPSTASNIVTSFFRGFSGGSST